MVLSKKNPIFQGINKSEFRVSFTYIDRREEVTRTG